MINRTTTYQYEQATDLLKFFDRPNYGTVVDLGAGLRDGPVSLQICAIPADKLISVEAFGPYIPYLQSVPVLAKTHEIVQANINNYAIPECDAVLMLDVLEHLTKDEGLALLARLKAAAGMIVVFIPLEDTTGYANDFKNLGNMEMQTHKSAWYAEELDKLGFDVDVYVAFHSHVVPGRTTDAAFAVWKNKSDEKN